MFVLLEEIPEENLALLEKWVKMSCRDDRGFILVDVSNTGTVKGYFGGGDFCHKFGSETEAEYPVVYRTLSGARRRARQLESQNDQGVLRLAENIRVAFWLHPDSQLGPLPKYLRMTGTEFPGSPTQ